MVMGSAQKKPTAAENRIKKVIRKSIVAKEDIAKETKITADMLIVKRPGTGIEAKHISTIVGKKSKKNIKKNQMLDWSMV
jgi:N,N'-diacetyllegionaminate synthase